MVPLDRLLQGIPDGALRVATEASGITSTCILWSLLKGKDIPSLPPSMTFSPSLFHTRVSYLICGRKQIESHRLLRFRRPRL